MPLSTATVLPIQHIKFEHTTILGPPTLYCVLYTITHTDRRSILGQKRSIWSVIESFEKSSSEFYETVVNVRGLPGIKYE